MTRIDIIRMAKESGMAGLATTIVCEFSELERFADLVAASEREACAALVEPMGDYCGGHGEPRVPSARDCAKAIRARGQA